MVTQAFDSIRECRADDLTWFARLGSTSHLQHCHREFARAQNGETLILVAVDENDAPIGKVHIDFVERAGEHAATIESAAVLVSLQSQGIGRALIQAAEARIVERGLPFAEVEVEDENQHARRLYERMGYREFARETFTYEIDGPAGEPVVVSNRGARLRKQLLPGSPPKLLVWARRLQAIAQTGVAYGEPTIYDRERYAEVRRIVAEMLAADGDVEALDGALDLELGQATPKLDVRGVVFDGEALLLVREKVDGHWTLPGGWVEVGESPSEAVVREVREESGYETRAVKLLALFDRDRHASTPHQWHVWKACFRCELVDRIQHEPDEEILEARFFTRSELPELDDQRIAPDYVERFFAHWENPTWPTDFD